MAEDQSLALEAGHAILAESMNDRNDAEREVKNAVLETERAKLELAKRNAEIAMLRTALGVSEERQKKANAGQRFWKWLGYA